MAARGGAGAQAAPAGGVGGGALPRCPILPSLPPASGCAAPVTSWAPLPGSAAGGLLFVRDMTHHC